MDDAERRRIASVPHGDPEHRCSWACPQSSPLADIQAVMADAADAAAGMSAGEIETRHSRSAPLFGIPYGAGDQ